MNYGINVLHRLGDCGRIRDVPDCCFHSGGSRPKVQPADFMAHIGQQSAHTKANES